MELIEVLINVQFRNLYSLQNEKILNMHPSSTTPLRGHFYQGAIGSSGRVYGFMICSASDSCICSLR